MIRKFTVDEVMRALLSRRNEAHAKSIHARVQTRLQIIGLTREERLIILRELRPVLPDVSEEFEWLNFLQDLWECNYFEARLLALEMMFAKADLVDMHLWGMLDHWTSNLDNWVHADWVGHVRAIALARMPAHVTRMAPWLTLPEVFRRRSAIMSLVLIDPKHLDLKPLLKPAELFAFVEPAFGEQHQVVQSALAWLLRLVRRKSPDDWRAYIADLKSRMHPETLRLLQQGDMQPTRI